MSVLSPRLETVANQAARLMRVRPLQENAPNPAARVLNGSEQRMSVLVHPGFAAAGRCALPAQLA